MLVCHLCLGTESSDVSNSDGDHIWVFERQYYVISSPAQILPQFIVKFTDAPDSSSRSELLESILELPCWSTRQDQDVAHVPKNRPCEMSYASTDALWIGYLHNHFSDEQLEGDVRRFLETYAAEYIQTISIRIVQSKFKKAHIYGVLDIP